jgi:hypothetical protein
LSIDPSDSDLRQRSNVFSGVENSARGAGSVNEIDLIFSRGSFIVCPPASMV